MNEDLLKKTTAQENLLDAFLVKYCQEEPKHSCVANKFQETYSRYVFLHDGHPMLGQRLANALQERGITLKDLRFRGVTLVPTAADEIEALIKKKNEEADETEELDGDE